MTRVNCVPVEELTREHLVAEYRELPRVFRLVQRAVERGERPGDRRNPSRYVLGPGHCRFFYPRLGYLARRHACLVGEMLRRGYQANMRMVGARWRGTIPDEWWGEWHPDEDALAASRARIAERLES